MSDNPSNPAGDPLDPGTPPTNPADQPGWARDFLSELKANGASNKELAEGMKQVIQLLVNQRPAGPVAPAEPEEKPVDPAHLETLSRYDFGQYLVNEVMKAVNKQGLEPLRADLTALRRDTTAQQIGQMVAKGEADHKDWKDWNAEMISLAGQFRGVPPERLYQMARADNPTKAKELDTKYSPEPKKDEKGPLKFRVGFGGLTPGQSGTGNRGRRMSSDEAAEVAYAETIKALGVEPMFDEE